ncbi:MAG: hypothetical protein EZS28_051420, partial [Streblomastix strix]
QEFFDQPVSQLTSDGQRYTRAPLGARGYTLLSIVDNAIKPKFTGTPSNIPLNAILFAQGVYNYPIDWTGSIPIDCYINLNGNVIINTMCKINLPKDFCVQVCDSYAIHNQSAD